MTISTGGEQDVSLSILQMTFLYNYTIAMPVRPLWLYLHNTVTICSTGYSRDKDLKISMKRSSPHKKNTLLNIIADILRPVESSC